MQIRKGILIFIIIAACVACYLNALFAGFVWDDNIFIVPNPYMQSFRFLPKFFAHDFWHIGLKSTASQYYRPLLAASFMLDASLWKQDPFGYHLSNIIFHTLTSIVLFLFFDLLLKERVIAFFSALIFSVHPLHAEVVSFVSGRVDSLPLFFVLLSLLLYLRSVHRNNHIFYICSLFSFFVALLFKEMAVTLPLLVLCIDFLFVSHCRGQKVLRNFLRVHLGFFLVVGVYLFLRYAVAHVTITEDALRTYPRNFSFGSHPYWRFFTALKIMALYLRLLFLPYNLTVEHWFEAADSLFEPMALAGFVLLLVFIFIAAKSARRQPALSFSMAWFFIALLPVSNIFPQGNIFAERYAYMPSVGYCLAVGLLFSWLLRQNISTKAFRYRRALYVLFAAWFITQGTVCYARSAVWQNDFTLWSDAVRKAPRSSLAHVNLAHAYLRMNYFDEALKEVDTAIQLTPFLPLPYVMRGHIYHRKGELDRAIEAFQAARERKTYGGEIYNALAVVYGENGQYELAIDAGLMALSLNPYLAEAHYNLAINYTNAGRIDEAIKAYEEFLKIEPTRAAAHVAVGHLYKRKGDADNAKRHWRIALQLWQDYKPAKDALLKLLEQ